MSFNAMTLDQIEKRMEAVLDKETKIYHAYYKDKVFRKFGAGKSVFKRPNLIPLTSLETKINIKDYTDEDIRECLYIIAGVMYDLLPETSEIGKKLDDEYLDGKSIFNSKYAITCPGYRFVISPRKKNRSISMALELNSPIKIRDFKTDEEIPKIILYLFVQQQKTEILIREVFFAPMSEGIDLKTGEYDRKYVRLIRDLSKYLPPASYFCSSVLSHEEIKQAYHKESLIQSYAYASLNIPFPRDTMDKLIQQTKEMVVYGKDLLSLMYRINFIKGQHETINKEEIQNNLDELNEKIQEREHRVAVIQKKLEKEQERNRKLEEQIMTIQTLRTVEENKVKALKVVQEVVADQVNTKELETRILKLEKELQVERAKCQHAINKLKRPNKIADVAEWAKMFSDRLIIIPKAEKMLQDRRCNSIDVDTLCDAIEYLAEEYLDSLTGKLDVETARDIASTKYQRSFYVSPITRGGASATRFEDFYNVNYDGKKRFLDLHLSYGVSPSTLIRIYFFYDKEEKKIVIGSLPKHLPTISES